MREWLPEDLLAWFVLEAVEGMDLSEFYADYRSDGHGRAAFQPSMMVGLVLYAYATEQRSSRGIEIDCRQGIAYRRQAQGRRQPRGEAGLRADRARDRRRGEGDRRGRG